jgi:hypothetical protein
MAGSPLKRQRKAGVRADDGRVIAFPRMPRAADLPPGWRHWSPAQKIERHCQLNSVESTFLAPFS